MSSKVLLMLLLHFDSSLSNTEPKKTRKTTTHFPFLQQGELGLCSFEGLIGFPLFQEILWNQLDDFFRSIMMKNEKSRRYNPFPERRKYFQTQTRSFKTSIQCNQKNTFNAIKNKPNI